MDAGDYFDRPHKKEDLSMDFVNAVQSVNALGAIAMILIGSAALKKYLKHFAV